MTEEERLYAALLDEVISLDQEANEAVTGEINSLQLEVFDIIDHYTRADGTINNSRVSRMLEDTRSVEDEHNNILFNGTVDGMDVVATATVAFLLANFFRSGTQRKLNIMDDMAMQNWINGMNLRDRTSIVSGDYGDRLRNTIRAGVYRNQSPSEIMSSVRGVHDGEQWKLDRIVTSELNNTYRMQFAQTAEANGNGWLQFYESQWCTSRNHSSHRCHILAHEDRHGRGEGVFRTTDSEIFFPHPQCRGYVGLHRG